MSVKVMIQRFWTGGILIVFVWSYLVKLSSCSDTTFCSYLRRTWDGLMSCLITGHLLLSTKEVNQCPPTLGVHYIWLVAHHICNSTPLQYSCLESPMDGGAWWAAIHEVANSQAQLNNFTFTFHFSLSCLGEGNGNSFQYSCLENPRDGGAWWATVPGVTQSRTWLKRLSSSSISLSIHDLSTLILHSICQQIWKTQQWPQDWKRSVFIRICKKGSTKESTNY